MAETLAKTKGATLTVDEAARMLRIGRSLAYEAVASGSIPSIRIGKRVLIPRIALEKLLETGRAA